MSAIAGICGCEVGTRLRRDVEKMCAAGAFRDVERYAISAESSRAHVCASASRKTSECALHDDGDVAVITSGEICDRGEAISVGFATTWDDAAFINRMYREDSSCGFLEQMDGEFVIAILDRRRQALHLATDRLGIGRVYILEDGSRSWFCSVTSGFTEAEGLTVTVDKLAAAEFLEVGYFLQERTWLQGCSRLPPGTIWSADLASGTTSARRYSTWHDIPTCEPGETVEHAASTAANLLRASVARRCRPGERMTVTLSGGLDSRALLGAALDCGPRLTAVSFGRLDSPDVRIAAKVARRTGVRHVVVEIGAHNWLQPRIEGIWRTGGELPLLHMHCLEARSSMAVAGDANLNGHAGDLILGGSYLRPSALNKPIDIAVASEITGASPAELLESVNGWASSTKTDYYFMENRVRRFTALGVALLEGCVSDRKPFVDRQLLDFTYSLPDSMRVGNRLYERMLLDTFPQLYRDIPWQTTGVPIAWPSVAKRGARLARGAARRARRLLRWPSARSFAEYASWLRDSPAREAVETLLMHPEALYAGLCDPRPCRHAWLRHCRGHDESETVARYLTMELWLQQAFEGRYRTWDEVEVACARQASQT